MVTNSDPVRISYYAAGSGADHFKGTIDELKIYPYARTAAQIKADYVARGSASGISAKVGNESSFLSNGLIGYWKMRRWGVQLYLLVQIVDFIYDLIYGEFSIFSIVAFIIPMMTIYAGLANYIKMR